MPAPQRWRQGRPLAFQPASVPRWPSASIGPSNPSATLWACGKPAACAACPAASERAPDRQMKKMRCSGVSPALCSWSAKWLSRNHRSSRYNNAPMPYSIFYNGNYAVHGTNQTSKLGRPASAGCVRLAPQHAAILFSLVKAEGLGNTRIVIRN